MRKNLTVLLLYSPTSEVRGKLRRYFYEVKANTFVGTVSSTVRDTLWQEIVTSGTEASIIIHNNFEQGFEYKTTKTDKNYAFEDFDGIILPTSDNNNLQIHELYAKPDYKLLNHLLDVGYVAEGLMKYGRAHNMAKAIANTMQLDIDTVISSISWLCAMHDIGKAHPKFIAKLYDNSVNDKLIELLDNFKERQLIPDKINGTGFRHERFSRDILKKWFNNNNYPIESEQFADLIAYHHQGKSDNDFSDLIDLKDIEWVSIHNNIIELINNHWSFDKKFSENQNFVNGVNYSILSIMVTADWIASGSKWRSNIENINDPKLCAEKFIKENELLYVPMKDRFKHLSWNKIFDFSPNEMQSKVIEASKTNPDLMIIEYPCGGGKTEAALSAAINMGQNKTGIFIATPTMSTAKGMTGRMNELAQKVNLGLNVPEYDSSILWSDEDMYKVPSELWVSKSRHRLLYPFAVGTVDQILKTMLYYRYACISLMGLSDKVLVIDEVHAYDSYMITEIKMLIKWAKFLSIPIILLSATLPSVSKCDLLIAAGCKKDELPSDNSYPLITTYGKNGAKCYPINSKGRVFKLNIIETADYTNTWNNELSKNYNGCSAFIEGTVDNTWELFKLAQNNNLDPIMFNGRDTLEHKENKTKLLLDKLGKNRRLRPDKLTVCATSIIEQSLDIDFDRLFTCLAPIDLLIQRFGRVWRHSDVGTIRENETVDNPITIIIPTNSDKLPKIYSETILERTISVLKGITEIDTVKDARWLIDTVYDKIDYVRKPQAIIKAGFESIETPNRDAMFDNVNRKYSRFKPIQNSTRYETYPSVSIAIVDPEDIVDIDTNYDKIKKVMRQNVVGIALYKLLNGVHTAPIKFNNKLVSDINFYLKDDLLKEHIELTDDGLKWNNN